ncbi:MAG: hypothetical protein C0602_11280 [Denitrovibrio sp.]|nr:MAG: hypothetical protein C0602_11280 [Denitrovibrio sp.]
MNLTVLGSGSAVQFENRGSASFLLESGGKKILLDAGFYVLDRMEKAGVMADEIDAVYISHKHPDHFMGLIHLLFALKNNYYTQKDELLIFGFKGLSGWLDSFRAILGSWMEPDIKISVSEENFGSLEDIHWQMFDTVHSDESTGVVIERKGKRLAYTGDTEYFDELPENVKGAELLIAECASGNDYGIKGHMSLNDIKKVVQIASVKKVLLTHIYPESDKTLIEWEEGETKFTRSYDLLKISL